MRPFTPNAFFTGDTLDMEKLNDNLEHAARDIKNSMDRRYTYSHARLDLDGVTNASAQVLRELALRLPADTRRVEVCAVEVVIYATASVDWVLSCSDTAWPSITVTGAGSTTEATGSSGIPVQIASDSTDTLFTMATAGVSTITRGYVIVHFRCDRWIQDPSIYTPYKPTLLTSASTGVNTLLDTELTSVASKVAADTSADIDIRCEISSTRNLAAAGSVAFRAPSGARRILRVQGYVVAAATETVTFSVSGGITIITFDVTGAGVAARATGGADAGVDATQADDPMDASDDASISMIDIGAASALLAYVVIWWS